MSRLKNYDLTKKEKEIYLAICEGGLIRREALSKQFFLSKATIQTHLNHIFEKMQIHSIAELIYRYYRKEEV